MKNALSLALSSLKARPSSWILSAASVACGMALLSALILLFTAVQGGMARNAENIDIVVGAKGSGLQLVLSSVYHADIPNGNITASSANKIADMRQVKKSIPLTMGDSYRGFRVIGTTPDYLGLYKADIAEGKIFAKDFEVVAGAETGLAIGDEFSAAHGFADGGDVHKDHIYKVTGILHKTGTVVDKLLVTTLHSVQEAHAHHHHDDEEHEHGEGHAHHDEEEDEGEAEGQITALLLQVRTSADRFTLPRLINRSGDVMAASPSYEMARLSQNLGVGRDFVLAISIGTIALSALLLFSALASGMATRQYDLAVLRVLGASPAVLFSSVLFEGMAVGLIGSFAGIVMGHIAAFAAASSLSSLKGMIMAGDLLVPGMTDIYLLALGMASGCVAALLPARRASRADIAALLARGAA